jgi:hypothetical protein
MKALIESNRLMAASVVKLSVSICDLRAVVLGSNSSIGKISQSLPLQNMEKLSELEEDLLNPDISAAFVSCVYISIVYYTFTYCFSTFFYRSNLYTASLCLTSKTQQDAL